MFRGAFTALITPFKDGRVDDDALTRQVERQIAAGIDGLVPCGTTGESATLTYAEHIHVVEVVTRTAAGRVPILAGAGANSTHEAIELARACKELGVSGTLQVTPYYNKPPPAGLIRHFSAIADNVGLPVVLYNVPSRTACDMQPDTIAELAAHPMIVGVKEATADIARVTQLRALCPPTFALLSGDDFTLLPFLASGGHGVISVASNVVPDLFAELCASAAKGDWERARALHERHFPLTQALFRVANPIPVKRAMAMLGLCEGKGELRSPLIELGDDDPTCAALRDALHGLELLSSEAKP